MFIELQNKLSTETHDVFYAATDIQNPIFHIVRRDRDTHAASCNCLRADCEFARAVGTRTEDDEVSAWLAEQGHDPGCGGQEFSDEEMEAQRRRDAELDAMFDALESEPVCPFCNRLCERVETESGTGLGERIFCEGCDEDVTDAIEREARR